MLVRPAVVNPEIATRPNVDMDELAPRIHTDSDEPDLAHESGDLLVHGSRDDEVYRAASSVIRMRARLWRALSRHDSDLGDREMNLNAIDEREGTRIDRVLVAPHRAKKV